MIGVRSPGKLNVMMSLTAFLCLLVIAGCVSDTEPLDLAYQPPSELDETPQMKYSSHSYLSRLVRPARKPQVMFVYNSEMYSPWSNWTDCIDNLCIEQRHRRCLDDSWNVTFGNAYMTMKCVSKYVVEKRQCVDKSKCVINAGLQLISDMENVCGRQTSRPHASMKIIGGQEANPHSWPWAVRVSYGSTKSRPERHACGGTLITPHWILTAAHCLVLQNPRMPTGKLIRLHDYMTEFLHVHIGDHHKSKHESGQRDQVVYQAIIHPEYKREIQTKGHDIALLYLQKPVEKSDSIGFACQPRSTQHLTGDENCIAVGWGRLHLSDSPGFNSLADLLQSILQTHPNLKRRRRRYPSLIVPDRPEYPDELHEVRLPIISNSECSKYYPYLTDLHVCAGQAGKDTCDGDSGGGLYCQSKDTQQWYIAGITSFGLHGCSKNPGIYTSTSAHFDWIAGTISKSPEV